jgi:predicted esterase
VPGPHGFSWDDPQIAEEELADAYADLRGTYRPNAGKIVLAGFSQGGALAVSLALRGEPFPSCGFIAVSPAFDMDDDQVQASLRMAGQRGVRGFIVSGEQDPALVRTRALHGDMIRFGIPCELEVRTGLGHAFPKDFPETLARALRHVLP